LDQPLKIENQKIAFIALGDNEINQKLLHDYEKAPNKIILASYISPMTAIADVVLPVATWAEQEGHFLNLDGSLQNAIKAVQAPDEVISCEEALQKISGKLGFKVNSGWEELISKRVPVTTIVKE
jgi:NADH dehydrogenase/NADH:ubiquinone oxidoreductase subunit G